MDKYEILKQIGDGTFGSVAKAVSKKTGQMVAIKKMKQKFYTWEECVKLPEVDVVRRIHGHPHVVKLREVIRENNELFFVFEFMDDDLLGVIKRAKQRAGTSGSRQLPTPLIPYPVIKDYMRQILQAIAYLHKRGYFHRDMKPENLLIRKEPTGDELLKLADFGLVKEIRSRPPFTDYVSTRWYRAPELLLQDRFYGPAIDIWATGCIMVELITTRPLFPGTNEVDQLFKIMSLLGSPTEETWSSGIRLAKKIRYAFPNVSGAGLASVLPSNLPASALDLITQMLAYDPKVRLTAEQCLQHPFFNVGIDESTAPSTAALDQLASATKRMLPVTQTAPPALKGSVVEKLPSPKAMRASIDMSTSDALQWKPCLVSPLKNGDLGAPKQSPSNVSMFSLNGQSDNASTSLRGQASGSPVVLPPVANSRERHSQPPSTIANAHRRSQDVGETSLAKKLAGLKNIQVGKGKPLPVSYALSAAKVARSASISSNLVTSPSAMKSPSLLPPPQLHDTTQPRKLYSLLPGTDRRSSVTSPTTVKRDVDLDELMEEFASEMTAMGVCAQRLEAGTPKEITPDIRARQSAVPQDAVAALLSNTRYKSSLTSLESAFKSSKSPRASHSLAMQNGEDGAAKNGLPSVSNSAAKNASPSLKALLAKHKTTSLAYQ